MSSPDSTSPRLRVVYFISYPQRMAGANRSLFELVINLPAKVKPIICVVAEGEVARAYRDRGISVYVLQPGEGLSQFGRAMLRWGLGWQLWVALTELLPYTVRLWKFLRQHEVDLVHVNDSRGCVLAMLAANVQRCALVAHMRGEMTIGGISRTIFERAPDRIICVCNAIRSSLAPRAQARSLVVYNGTRDVSGLGSKIPWFSFLRSRGVTVVSCFASIVPFKGHACLLDALALLNRRGWHEKVLLVCVGELVPEYQEYQERLFQKMEALNIRNCLFAGWQPDPFSFYCSSDAAVLASANHGTVDLAGATYSIKGGEGFPRTHLEAMSFGLPIVTTDNAGAREQVADGVNGYVVPPHDPSALADALEKVLADPSRRRGMGEAGKLRVQQRFSTAAYVEGVMGVYDGCACR